MALTTTMFTGLTGMKANSQTLDVVGNNIANVNTTAFKRSQAHFETQVSQVMKNGSAPSALLGGTNPAQIGLGTRLAAIARDFSDGGLQPTGVATHAAMEGAGFFIVEAGGAQRFTRDGTFELDRDFNLVSSSGARVQGYGVDDEFQVVEGLLGDVNIPLGVLTIAQATENVSFTGVLNASGDIATAGQVTETEALFSDAAATTAATAATALDSVYNASGVPRFAVGDVITIKEISRGGANLPTRTFEVGPANTTGSDDFGSTLGDFAAFLQDILGIDTTQAGTPGVSIGASGQIVIEANTGVSNAIVVDAGDIIVNQGTASSSVAFGPWTDTQEATGESARTTVIAYDSLGNALEIDLTVVLEDKTAAGTSWRFYAHSNDDTDLNKFMGTGTLEFDTGGQFVSSQGSSLVIDRFATGALDPQTITLNFTDQFGAVTALADKTSQINQLSQDGTPIGTLEDFSISEDGTIVGVFSNSLLRDLGRLPVAMFSNTGGLLEVGGNMYANTSNSGSAQIVNAGSGGSGRIIGRALELSNVDLAQEFISLISAQTGFSANSRIISTSDRLIQELLATIR